MKAYSAAKAAQHLAKKRGPDWQPKSTPRHAMLDCDGTRHRCTGCNSIKLITEFPNNKETPCGKDPRCKQCRHEARRERMGAVLEKPRAESEAERRARIKESARKYAKDNEAKLSFNNKLFKLKANFNMTMDQLYWLFSIQKSRCFLCGEPEVRIDSRTGLVMRLSIDHDHRCCPDRGKSCGTCVRHLLCSTCNIMIGFAENKPAVVYRFADYIDLRPLQGYPGEGNWKLNLDFKVNPKLDFKVNFPNW